MDIHKKVRRTKKFFAVVLAAELFLSGCGADAENADGSVYHMSYPDVSTESVSTVLPVVEIWSDEDIGRSAREIGIAITDDPGGTPAQYLYSGGATIHLRGNSTKYREKQPYKIKLDKKADLFGMGESKHWVLLANDIDHTLIRNKITLDFARSIGQETASRSVLVNLYLNDEYRGVYQLAEHVRVGKNRVDIYDWENTFEAEAQPETRMPQTGGFLLEGDFYAYNSKSKTKVITAFQQPFYFNTPEHVSEESELYRYTKNYIQSFEYALHSPDHTYHAADTHYEGKGIRFTMLRGWKGRLTETDYHDETFDGYHYSELFDMDSLLQNMLVCEVSMNWDSMKNSTFLYKDIHGKAYMGPAWDYDWAYGNINMYNIDTCFPTQWHTTNEYFTNEWYYQSVQWNRYLIKDPYFLYRLYEKYHEIRDNQLQDLVDSIEKYRLYLTYDGKMNDTVWLHTYNERYYGGGKTKAFSGAYDDLGGFVTERIAWLDEQFADFDTLVSSFGACVPDESIRCEKTAQGLFAKETVYTVSGDFSGMELQINGVHCIVFTGRSEAFIDPEYLDRDNNVIQIRPLDENGDYIYADGEGEPDEFPVSSYCVHEGAGSRVKFILE